MSVKHKKKSYLDILPRKGDFVRVKSEDVIRAMMCSPNTILYPGADGKSEQLYFSDRMIEDLCGKEVEVTYVPTDNQRYFMVRGWTGNSRSTASTSSQHWYIVPEILEDWV